MAIESSKSDIFQKNDKFDKKSPKGIAINGQSHFVTCDAICLHLNHLKCAKENDQNCQFGLITIIKKIINS